ncbi:MAG: LamG domain-containing protein [Pirellulales bacterium]|nr:LamG domain-containing protein [Pirellulales bacterium]
MSWESGPGGLGQAANFGSVYRYLYVDVHGKSDPVDSAFSLATWFKTTESNCILPAIHGAGGDSWDAVALEITGGKPTAWVREPDLGAADNRLVYPENFADGQWHHMALTFTGGGDDTLRLFVDGKLAGVQAQAAGQINISAWQVAKRYGEDVYYAGALDDVRMYARALDDGGVSIIGQPAGGDVAQLYAMGIPEPSTWVLLVGAFLGLLPWTVARRMRRS